MCKRKIDFDGGIVLAPMAGTSNPSYMKICEEMGVSYVVTELISAEAIVRDNKKTLDMLNGISDINIPVGVQLFGSKPDVMAHAASIVFALYPNVYIDINMGCPVPKVVKSGAGSALLKDVSLIYDIVKEVVSSVSCPVSVKIRSGWDNESINAVEVAKTIEKAGASFIAIHPRTRSMGYTGSADWDIIKEVVSSVSIPVIGNGDIKTVYDAKKMLDYTGCYAVMIGRSLLGNPWFIKECISYLDNGIIISKPSYEERINMILRHYELLKKYNGERSALLEIRMHALWYMKGIPGIKEYKNLVTSCNDEDSFLSLIYELRKKVIDKNC